MMERVGWFALSLGRLHDAETIFDKLTTPTVRHIMQFNVAAVTGDVGRMQEELRRVDSSERPSRYIRAGLFDDARRADAKEPLSDPLRPLDPAYRLIPRAYFALLAGKPQKAIAYVREGFTPESNPGLLEHEIGCETLAAALESLQRRDEAIAALEACAAKRPQLLGDLIAPFWMQLKLHLADTYRRSGRVDDAVKQEQEVRQLLAVADRDHPFLKRLNAVAQR
jgi:tetratricopeptide (TPR) repeat protein